MSGLERVTRRVFEAVCGALFALLLAAFLLQIVKRYVFGEPLAWSLEFCSLAYVWLVTLGAATILREREHVTFDLFYGLARPPARRFLAIIGTATVVVLFGAGLPGTLDYLVFMHRQRTLSLHLPMSIVFGGFAVLLVAVVVFGGLRLRRLLGPRWQDEL